MTHCWFVSVKLGHSLLGCLSRRKYCHPWAVNLSKARGQEWLFHVAEVSGDGRPLQGVVFTALMEALRAANMTKLSIPRIPSATIINRTCLVIVQSLPFTRVHIHTRYWASFTTSSSPEDDKKYPFPLINSPKNYIILYWFVHKNPISLFIPAVRNTAFVSRASL